MPDESTLTLSVPYSALSAPRDPSDPIEAMRDFKFRIRANDIISGIKDMIDRGAIDEDQATLLQWFAGYCRHKNLDKSEVSSLLRKSDGDFYSYDSVYQTLTGRRIKQGAEIAPILKAMEDFRAAVEPASRIATGSFITTATTAAAFAQLDKCRRVRKILPVVGDSHIGKSEIIAEYTRIHNHGETIAIDMPPRASLAQFQGRLGRILALANTRRTSDLGDAILDSFRAGMLLVVDNFHRALRRPNAYLVGDFIQEIFDSCEIGIALFMTCEGRDLLTKGPERKRLQQLWRRRMRPMELPQMLPPGDLAKFAAARGLDPAPKTPVGIKRNFAGADGETAQEIFKISPFDLQKKVIAAEGLGVWCSILDDAVDLAKSRHQPVTWDAVLTAYCLFN